MADGAAPTPDVGGQSAYWLLARGVATEPGSLATAGDACASCEIAVADCDAAYTAGGQRVHRDGCPVDEVPRKTRGLT